MKRKIIFFSFICLAVLCAVLAFAASASASLVGDVNGDGSVDYTDAYLVLNFVSGDGFLDIDELDRADIDNDGIVTSVDAAQIFHYINGKLSALPYTYRGKGYISLEAYPEKTEYYEGEQIDFSGMKLSAIYENGYVKEITDYSYSGYSSTPGVKLIIISYKEAKVAFTVTVYPSVIGIDIATLPNKTVYSEGDSLELDTSGMVVEAILSGGKRCIVTDYSVWGFEPVAGNHIVTVVYRGYSASFDVTVEGEPPEEISDIPVQEPEESSEEISEESSEEISEEASEETSEEKEESSENSEEESESISEESSEEISVDMSSEE